MRDTTGIADQPPALDEVPILLETARPAGPDPTPRITVDRSRLVDGFGIFSRDDIRDRLSHERVEAPTHLDWSEVVDLRRRVSEAITEEAGHQLRRTGRPVTGDDRLLMGRAIIRRVVGDHVRALHRDGDALW